MKTILICLLLLIPVVSATSPISTVGKKSEVESTIEQRIIMTLEQRKVPIPMQKLILAQARFESGNFTNGLTVKGNNLFGMRHPSIRRTTSLGPTMRAEGRVGYAKFISIESSVEDLLLYFECRNIPDTFATAPSYARILKEKRYYESSLKDYTRGLNRYLIN